MSFRSGINEGSSVHMPAVYQQSRPMEPVHTPIQYVFIDESQRDSKRPKITRACESCRRRKVKCDSPQVAPGDACTSCRRLGVECVLQQNLIDGASEDRSSTKSVRSASGYAGDERMPRTISGAYETNFLDGSSRKSTTSDSPRSTVASDATFMRPIAVPNTARARRLSSASPMVSPMTTEPRVLQRHGNTSMTLLTDPTEVRGVNVLTNIFGKLNIQLGGKANFVHDESDLPLPPYDTEQFNLNLVGLKGMADIGHPVSYDAVEGFLPADDLAMDLISLYFRNIHPYIPVLNKTTFLRDWLGYGRRNMSPYLLVSFFAAAARFSDDPRVYAQADDCSTRGDRWNNLVHKYREDFRDAPRLTTIQADIINLKALEARSKVRGYFYRSWFLLSSILRMGKDLGLHRMSQSRAQDPDSVTGRRVWQVCLIMDQLMGTSQGRELQLNMAEVDLTLLPLSNAEHGLDLDEVRVHNDFIYLTGLIKILRRCTEVHLLVGIKFPFAAEPQYPALSEILLQWRDNLPPQLQLPADLDTALPSHFVANLHLSYCMVVCLLHRPWIVSVGEYGATGEWRMHLRICNDAARRATKLYEMLLQQYGDKGLKWMIRGSGYAIYGTIIMTMIHAVCLTCPESEFSEGAREYFDRSVALLDKMPDFKATPQMSQQLDILRGVFKDGSQSSTAGRPLPPELASLQEQYTIARNAATRKRPQTSSSQDSLADFSTSYDSGRSIYQQGPSGSLPSGVHPSAATEDSFYSSMPMNGADVTRVNTGSHDLSSLESSPTTTTFAGGPTNWNPAGLIGAWTQNFPIASTGMDYTTQFLMQHNTATSPEDSHLIPVTQTVPYYSQSQGHMQHYAEQIHQQQAEHPSRRTVDYQQQINSMQQQQQQQKQSKFSQF